jgi:hypothetical protein
MDDTTIAPETEFLAQFTDGSTSQFGARDRLAAIEKGDTIGDRDGRKLATIWQKVWEPYILEKENPRRAEI